MLGMAGFIVHVLMDTAKLLSRFNVTVFKHLLVKDYCCLRIIHEKPVRGKLSKDAACGRLDEFFFLIFFVFYSSLLCF